MKKFLNFNLLSWLKLNALRMKMDDENWKLELDDMRN